MGPKAKPSLKRLDVPEVLPERILEWVARLVEIARRPTLSVFFAKHPSIKVLQLNNEYPCPTNYYYVDFSCPAVVSDNDAAEC